jgi:hypothetical protein
MPCLERKAHAFENLPAASARPETIDRAADAWHSVQRGTLEDLEDPGAPARDRSRAQAKPGRRPWRVGRSLGRTVYDADDRLLGMLDTPDLAAVVVACVNAQPEGATVTLDPRCSWCGRPVPPYVDPPSEQPPA